MDVLLKYLFLVVMTLVEFQYKGEGCLTFNMTYGGRAYWCSPKYLTFNDAEHECNINGGHLADVPDEETNDAIYLELLRFSQEYRWIGVHDRIDEGEYLNMRNMKQTYLQWGDNGPPNGVYYLEADCVAFFQGLWIDSYCYNSFQALCSKPLGYTSGFVSQAQSTLQTETLQYSTGINELTLSSTASREHNSDSESQTTKTVTLQLTQNESSFSESFTTKLFRMTSPSYNVRGNISDTTSQEIELNTQHMSMNETSTYVFEFGGCTCTCRTDSGTDNQTWMQEMKIARIKAMLLVAKSTLSSRIRRKISADDPRTTSRVIGNVLGAGVLTTIAFFVVTYDIFKLYRRITKHK